ncbi:MAG: nitrate reductase subunit beta, partial [Acidimicrobiia bacterium]
MDVRSQVSMVFHLDKCIGCHTCSIACKNVWTDRQGTEYMWWNNVETKPGTGYPTAWEDQTRYKGGWVTNHGKLRLKSTGKARLVANIFHNPHMPSMDDYYEPWTYDYQTLFNAPEGTDQPVARPVSRVTGEYMEIEAGPNFDDDLGGSPVYAENDPNLEGLTPEQRDQLFAVERLVFFYFPRICNHCLNPSCVASCPSGALYKRGEDGIVLIDQKRCRAWRSCVAACPYKKTFYNWHTGKSEKCILCYPRLETGQAPACFHSCVGRIRYLGVLLYDADLIEEVASRPDEELVEAQREMILDPFDVKVIAAARANGIADDVITSAQMSPVYQFVKVWKVALPPHIEFRTLPMLFYVPPMSPIMASRENDILFHRTDDLFH